MLRCEDVMRKTMLESYSEFYFALCLAAEMGRRGDALDMSNIKIDSSLLSDRELNYYRYLKSMGYINLGTPEDISTNNKKVSVSDLKDYVDTKVFTDMFDTVIKERENEYFWSTNWVRENYINAPLFMRSLANVGAVLVHLVAHLVVCFSLEDRKRKKIHIKFNAMESRNTSYYVNLMSCCLTMDWFKSLVYVDIEDAGASVDVDYSIFYNNGKVAGRIRDWGINDKKRFMEKYGMAEGAIVVLYTRKGVRENNPLGRIASSTIARIDEITKDEVYFTTCMLNKTKEEVLADYNSIADEHKPMFADLLEFKPKTFTERIPLYSLGIYNYFNSESFFICPIDKNETGLVKKVTVLGEVSDVFMSAIEAIYWLLCEYGIDFDKELYREMYNGGKELLYDNFGEDTENLID